VYGTEGREKASNREVNSEELGAEMPDGAVAKNSPPISAAPVQFWPGFINNYHVG